MKIEFDYFEFFAINHKPKRVTWSFSAYNGKEYITRLIERLCLVTDETRVTTHLYNKIVLPTEIIVDNTIIWKYVGGLDQEKYDKFLVIASLTE